MRSDECARGALPSIGRVKRKTLLRKRAVLAPYSFARALEYPGRVGFGTRTGRDNGWEDAARRSKRVARGVGARVVSRGVQRESVGASVRDEPPRLGPRHSASAVADVVNVDAGHLVRGERDLQSRIPSYALWVVSL